MLCAVFQALSETLMFAIIGTALLGFWLLAWALDTRPAFTSQVLLLTVTCYAIDVLRQLMDHGSLSPVRWRHSLNRWGNRNLSPETYSYIFSRAGIGGLVLVVLGRRMDLLAPGTHVAWVICGFVGLLLIAISVAFGLSILIRHRLIRRAAPTSLWELQ